MPTSKCSLFFLALAFFVFFTDVQPATARGTSASDWLRAHLKNGPMAKRLDRAIARGMFPSEEQKVVVVHVPEYTDEAGQFDPNCEYEECKMQGLAYLKSVYDGGQ